jgi:hypothetical protein
MSILYLRKLRNTEEGKKQTSLVDLKQPTPGLPSKLWLPLPPMPQGPDSRVYLTAIPAIFQANTVIPIFQ